MVQPIPVRPGRKTVLSRCTANYPSDFGALEGVPPTTDAVPIKLFGGTEDADLSKRYRDMGVLRVVMTLPPELAEKTFPVLDRLAELIRRINA